jgi:serine/threonine protein kinase
MTDVDKISLELKKCKITEIKPLGMGLYGTTFEYTSDSSGNKYVIKYVGCDNIIEASFHSEWECTNKVYNKLSKKLPYHVIRPLTTWCCKYDDIPITIKSLLKNPRSGISKIYKVMVFDKLGDCTLKKFLKTIRTTKVRYEIIIQLLFFLIYLKTCTSIVHNDLHSDNIIIKKNTKNDIISYITPTHVYTIIPEYLAYPIDFGCCKYTGGDNDFEKLWINIIYLLINEPNLYFSKKTEYFYTSTIAQELGTKIVLKNKKLEKCKYSKKFLENESYNMFEDYLTVTKRDKSGICNVM